jgi:lipopolysaccharide/colanic/teichoic acid biosynthesis glycosyltransferase
MRSFIERAAAGALLLVCAPVLAVLAAVVRWRLGGPVLFTQERLGQGEVPFRLHKLRTMTDDRDPATGALRADTERLTPFGRRLRATSLDELPELWNVLAGDMAFVGPRPLPVAYRDRFTAEERRRHEVRPGITGWAQVRGRNQVDWDERLALDVWYVDHRSLRLDLRILALTVGTVLRRDGVSGSGAATMAELPEGRVDV